MEEKQCTHKDQMVAGIKGKTDGCEECLKINQGWVSLRVCQTCGHVGCCDSSIGKHATKHFKETGHPIMKEYPSESWGWCYIDETMI
jgi:uncharacterized UBP type Zn finger protein